MRRVWVFGGLALIYFGAGKIGLSLAFLNPSASAVWPPTGIALASILLFGYKVWPSIFIGAFLVNLTTAGTFTTSLGIATGNTLEALAGSYLVIHFAHGRMAFDRTADILKFAGLAAILSTALSATIGVTTLAAAGFVSWPEYGSRCG